MMLLSTPLFDWGEKVQDCRKWNPALPDARVSPSPLADRGRSPPPSFHYTPCGRASRGRGGSLPPRTKVELYEPTNKTSMSYIESFDAELFAKLESGTESTEAIVRWVSEKVLESYRNGITAGQKGASVKRQGQSRRRPFYGKAE